ncbi:MAG TPA: Ig-like domain-containing protein [Albitalea sp.]|uniref:Ig-like domain-containing protein n=1 Tax=Piscinibacter sp. TaxID=1903157 RepID=UPI002ED1947A
MGHARMTPRLAPALLGAFAILSPTPAHPAGPGLPNLSYSSAEVFKPLSVIKSNVSGAARGHGTVQMVDGYLFVPFGVDSGHPGGGFSFYDISNPRSPVKVSQVNNSGLREPHGFGFSNSYPGRYLVMQAVTGIQFWDITNPLAPSQLKALALPGIKESDYNEGAWWTFWQAPYVYVGGSSNGLLIVDATDPRNPVYLKTITTPFRIGPVFAVGNLLVTMSMDRAGILTYDISDPANPKLLANSNGSGGQYSGIVNGERLVTAGTDNKLRVYNISNPGSISQLVASPDVGAKGGYVSIQDGFAHAGFSTKYAKINLSTGAIVGTGTSGISGRDEDFGTVLGNLVMVGDDHAVGSALMPHQTAPDTTGPSVNMVSPKANSTNQSVKSRIGITLTDQVDLRTVNSSTFVVRPLGGSALAGKYSGQSGILNFWPDQALAAGTTYEVIVPAGGLRDDAGNAVPTTFSSRFTTGGTAPGVDCTLAAERTPALIGSSVGFSPASASGSSLQYSWNFGDGNGTAFSSTPTASHAYAGPGHYSVILTVRSGTQTDTCDAIQTVHTPLTAVAPRSSSTIAYDAGRNRVFVVNSDTNTVTAINAASNTKLFEQPVGENPQTLAQAPDGRIWVANHGAGTISILNPDTGAVAQTLTTGSGTKPFGVVFSPDARAAYVSLQGTGTLLKLNPSTGATQGTVVVGPTPRGIAVSGDSQRILVTRYISPVDRGQVTEVSAASFSVARGFSLAFDDSPDTESSGRGVPNFISSITIQPDGKRAWVPSKKDNTARGLFRDGLALTFESTVRTIVSQLDLEANTEALVDRLDINDRDMANFVLFTPIGDFAFVSTQGTNTIEILDATTRATRAGIDAVGRAPRGAVISSGGRLYVQNFMSRTVSVYDVNGILKSNGQPIVKEADIATVAGETLSAQVLSGKKVFYNAADRRMNLDKYISCASCHQDGGQDGRVMDFTDRGEGLRNTVTLAGRRGTGQGRVHWTANFDEIQDFEHDIRGPFRGLGFLTDAQFNTGTRNQPLGDPKAGLSTDLDAMAAYVSSLGAVGRSPFRNADGSMTADAVAGQAIFQGSGGCTGCHGGPDFTDSAAGVLHDVGTIKPSSGKRLGQTLTGLDTPTLKGVWETGPYLHDGSAATLLDVLTTANAGNRHGNTAGLTPTQLQQLVAYLQQLDDSSGATPGLVISALSPKDTANAPDWSLQGNLQVGNTVYGDRTFTFTAIPAGLLGSQWIRTANDSKTFTGNPTVTFNISVAADVHVALNNGGAVPSWVDSSWTNTATSITTRESSTTTRTYTVYRKRFNAGTVSLGPWNSTSSMYTVIVK